MSTSPTAPSIYLDERGMPAIIDAWWARWVLRGPMSFLRKVQYPDWPVGPWTVSPEAWAVLCAVVCEPVTTQEAVRQTLDTLRQLLAAPHPEGVARAGCDHLLVTLVTRLPSTQTGLRANDFFEAARQRSLSGDSLDVPLETLATLLAFIERQNRGVGEEVAARLAREVLGPRELDTLARVPWTTAEVWTFLVTRAAEAGWPAPLVTTVRETLTTCWREPTLWSPAFVSVAGGAIAGPGLVARLQYGRGDDYWMHAVLTVIEALPATWWATLPSAALTQLLAHPVAAVRTAALLHVPDVRHGLASDATDAARRDQR